jgi:hypothetical protein
MLVAAADRAAPVIKTAMAGQIGAHAIDFAHPLRLNAEGSEKRGRDVIGFGDARNLVAREQRA